MGSLPGIMKILVPNLGSTSLKYQLLGFPEEEKLVAGRMERIGCPGGDAASYQEAVSNVLQQVGEVDAAGFKAVHAGPQYRGTFRVDDKLLAALEEYEPAAPVHNSIYLEGIREFRAQRPGLDLVAVLEPGFHRTMPAYASVYGVPEKWKTEHGIQRFGFHGASHRSISERIPQFSGRRESGLRIISCHLGGSSSICAIRDGQSVDTTMGFSPQSGLENASRHGDLDPFAVLFLMERLDMSTVEMRQHLVAEGGLAGLSGIAGGDVRDIEKAAENGNVKARLALDTFAYQVRKTIGAYCAAMGGLDVLSFTGGIGENSASFRKLACEGLAFLGIELDDTRNEAAGSDRIISPDDSPVTCVLLSAQEELVVGRETYQLLAAG